MICGSGASSMHLSALLPCGTRVDMERDTDTLYDLRIVTGSEVHVDDSDVHSLSALGAFTDTSKVDKYEIAEEDYAKRNDTIRDHIMKLKQTNPEKFPVKAPVTRPKTPENIRELYPLSSRCEVNPGGRRGVIAYVGPIDADKGTFVGVCLDEPSGRNDGTHKGKRYFECKGEGYGLFARHENVTVGDFPELDPFSYLDEL
eukprot:GHVR01069104.1.p1 GENE.GHVR01069104.1~~GHVR01069104.1.p1  ORF type:complete len:201 (+),score=27.70 GHVR01069104.1:109-711(+)